MQQQALIFSEQDRSFRERAERWIENNSVAWRWIEQTALALVNRRRRFSMDALVHRVRWEMVVDRGDDTFKVNNVLVASFSRILIERHPEVAAYLETRTAKKSEAA